MSATQADPPAARAAANALRMLAIMAAGAVLSYGLTMVWDLETRWLVVVIIGLAGVAVAMLLVNVFSDVLMIACLCLLPAMSFTKWFWPTRYAEDERGNLVYAGLLGIGPLDFILVGLYLSWFYRVFALREAARWRLCATDWLVLAYIGIHLLSSLGAQDQELSLGATEYLTKYALLYFYLSRNLQARHLPWLLGAFALAIVVEAALGSVQFATGDLLGIALDKGAGSSEVNYQYSVPGIESFDRATGTAYDSHSLGNLMAMLLPFPIVLAFTPRIPAPGRAVCAMFALLAGMVVIMTLSRAAWVSAAVSLGIGLVLIIGVWREKHVVPLVVGAAMVALVGAPFLASFIYNRFAESPYEVLSTRFDQYKVALEIISRNPLFGFGPGNWINALSKHDFLWLEILPPHNVILWILAECGAFGLFCYLAIVVGAVRRLFRLVSRRRDLPGRIGMATLIALTCTVFVGLTDPTYREPDVFAMFWALIALSVALPHMPPVSSVTLMRAPRGPRVTIADLIVRKREV